MRQRGQAIAEIVVLLIIFMVMLLSLKISMKISDSRDSMLLQGLSLAISSARGAGLSDLFSEIAKSEENPFKKIQYSNDTKNHQSLVMRELGMKTYEWTISANRDQVSIPRLLKSTDFHDFLDVRSIVQIKGFSSHASDSNQVVKQITQTNLLWGAPARLTNQLSRFVSAQTHLTDMAWKRAKPNNDLLSSWKDK